MYVEYISRLRRSKAQKSNRSEVENMQRRKKARSSNDGDVLKGLIAGAVGGLVASWTMDQFQALWSKLSEENDNAQQKRGSQPQQSGQESGQQGQDAKQGGEEEEPATEKAAEAISENVFDHELTKSEKKVAGPAVHYAMGITSGAIYGMTAELVPLATVGAGIPFGTAVWLVADEAAVPALGLSKSPTEVPLSKHAYALVSHFVYGLTTDVVRRAVRSAL